MSVRAAAVLGLALIAAAVLHGGFYAAGHDFVVNRFTGRHEFVPAPPEEDEAMWPVRRSEARRSCRALTSRGGDARVVTLQRRR
jgi:hypothetical protein